MMIGILAGLALAGAVPLAALNSSMAAMRAPNPGAHVLPAIVLAPAPAAAVHALPAPATRAVPVAALTAIPAFARKYGVTCSLCHSPAPRLNAFGEQFAANGFEMVAGEPPRDTLDTGDPLLRLQRGFPLAVRIDAYVQGFTDAPADATRFDLQTPYNIKLLAGGQIADGISYYMYFFLSERGEVTGLEDAYVQFTDIANSGVSVLVGQFQASDPMFKRELRLEFEDYQIYRVRVGQARADLTYDRGLMAVASPWKGGDVAVQVLNGRGLDDAGGDRLLDTDAWKTFGVRASHDFGPFRLGGYGYLGHEREDGTDNRIMIWGPDVTVPIGQKLELNGQYLRREDSDPFFGTGPADTHVDALMAELIWAPAGQTGRWFVTGLYNDIRSASPLFTIRQGEPAPLDAYRSLALSTSYVLRRNVKWLGEVQWDFEREAARLTAGFTMAF